MKNTKKSITFKVLIGYLLVATLAVFAVWIVYGQIVNLTRTNKIGNLNNQKLILISEAVTNLYVAEGISRNIIQNEKASLLPKFHAELDTITRLIDSLKQLYENGKIKTELDSITHLLTRKESNLRELLVIRGQGASQSIYARALEKLKGNKSKSNYIYEGNMSELDPSVRQLIIRRRNYLQSVNWNRQKTDSVLKSMQSVLKNLNSEEQHYQSILNEKENELLESDRQISLQLRKIRSEIEQEEIQNSVAQVAQSQKILERTSTYIALIGAGSVLIMFLFILLIIRDTNRSQKYRQELEHAKNFAESLLKGREQIMATVTHDLRSPLNNISGYSDLLQKTKLNEKQAHYLGHLQKSSDYILRLVNDLLDLSKLEVGKMTVEELPFNPKNLIQEAWERSIPVENPKQLKLKTVFSPDMDRQVVSDPFRIQQILSNLITNAYKFTEQGKIEIQAELTVLEKGKYVLKIAVEDSGIGISKEKQALIFEEFSQAETSIEKKYGGFGLGLAITKKLTTLLDGEMILESELGKGSRFSIIIPVALGNASSNSSAKKNKLLSYHFKDTKGKKVCIVDDEMSQLLLTSEIIKQSGLNFDTCKVPLEAFQQIKKEHYDLVLTDIQMPRMDGFQLLKKIHNLPKTAHLPVIALSGRADVNQKIYAQKGFKGNLIKPFHADELLRLIADILELELVPVSKEETATETPEKTALYDTSDLKNFIQNDDDTLREILLAFVEGTKENIKILDAHRQSNNREGISQMAHKMLPMYKQLYITPVLQELQVLEKQSQVKTLEIEKVCQLATVVIEHSHTVIAAMEKALR